MSALEEAFATQLRERGLAFQREFKFHPKRRWRIDFAFPDERVGVEVEGGTWSGGRHTRGSGFAADCEKYAQAMCLGWRVLRVTGDQVKSGEARLWLFCLLQISSVADTTKSVA